MYTMLSITVLDLFAVCLDLSILTRAHTLSIIHAVALLVFCRKKTHFGRKYHLNFMRMSFGTPLQDFDNMCHWATNVKEQHYATHPARDAVANTLGFASANAYYIPRADLNPENMPEFRDMVNKVFPWLGRAFAYVTAVSALLHIVH